MHGFRVMIMILNTETKVKLLYLKLEIYPVFLPSTHHDYWILPVWRLMPEVLVAITRKGRYSRSKHQPRIISLHVILLCFSTIR